MLEDRFAEQAISDVQALILISGSFRISEAIWKQDLTTI
jgi:hypothetical protein